MSCSKSMRRIQRSERFRGPAGAGLVAVLIAGGCSADVARFDSPTFNLTEKGSGTKLPSEPMQGSASNAAGAANGGAYFPPPSNRPAGSAPPAVRMSTLPEPSPSAAPAPYAAPRAQQVAAAMPAKPIATPPAAGSVGGGDTIEVQTGDTLFGLAKKHHVSVAELMSVNDLKSPALKPGQKLVLPAGKSAARKPLIRTEPPKLAAAPTPAKPVPFAAQAAPAASDWAGSYTVKSGDSPYGIARQHRVSLDELNRVNGIADPRKIKPGAVLKVPTGALFRVGERWAVYVIEDGRARQRLVTLGHQTGQDAEVVEGLNEGAPVIVHPGDTISDGVRVREGLD